MIETIAYCAIALSIGIQVGIQYERLRHEKLFHYPGPDKVTK